MQTKIHYKVCEKKSSEKCQCIKMCHACTHSWQKVCLIVQDQTFISLSNSRNWCLVHLPLTCLRKFTPQTWKRWTLMFNSIIQFFDWCSLILFKFESIWLEKRVNIMSFMNHYPSLSFVDSIEIWTTLIFRWWIWYVW